MLDNWIESLITCKNIFQKSLWSDVDNFQFLLQGIQICSRSQAAFDTFLPISII